MNLVSILPLRCIKLLDDRLFDQLLLVRDHFLDCNVIFDLDLLLAALHNRLTLQVIVVLAVRLKAALDQLKRVLLQTFVNFSSVLLNRVE